MKLRETLAWRQDVIMNSPFIRIHRDGEDIAFLTRDMTEKCFAAGLLKAKDWAVEKEGEWLQVGQLFPCPPPLPLPVRPAKPKVRKQSEAIIWVAAVAALIMVIALFGRWPAFSNHPVSTPMPQMEGDEAGNPTPEDLRAAAEWLLQQERLQKK